MNLSETNIFTKIQFEKIYSEMPQWKGFTDGCPQWYSEDNKFIEGSVEPSGLQLYAKLPQEEWNEWIQLFKDKATEVLGILGCLWKESLEIVGETGPYILAPHSMSGLEAIRWKQKYPNDVSAIIGIDMATPLIYNNWTDEEIKKRTRLMRVATRLKFANILCQLNNRSLTKDEINQHKLLRKRNAFNICYINEASEVLKNSRIVSEDENVKCPTLLFSSNGNQTSEYWLENQQEFATLMSAKLICFDCGHYIHHFKSDEMCKEIIEFINSLER